ncbi:hypothetical protein GCM10025864_43140 [Luteimicrobium album]|uniref:Trigger factor ribosome-binding bacterial domain-containing protein n=1 Tax=Luteimicrobium album TaxID=1054550 RepID=A0ABQ6I7P7_9MICO|nr:hypothetical protein GCM10025864_43140 [Luteimicrobium album]
MEIIEVKSAVESLDPTKVKLTVEVEYDELKPSIEHAYEHIASEVQVPGFRKGKVPPRVIDQRVGRAAVLEHAINDGLGGFYSEAVRENDLRPSASPRSRSPRCPTRRRRTASSTSPPRSRSAPRSSCPSCPASP